MYKWLTNMCWVITTHCVWFFKGAKNLHKPSNVDQRLAPLLFGEDCLRATNIDFGVECEYEALVPSSPIKSRL